MEVLTWQQALCYLTSALSRPLQGFSGTLLLVWVILQPDNSYEPRMILLRLCVWHSKHKTCKDTAPRAPKQLIICSSRAFLVSPIHDAAAGPFCFFTFSLKKKKKKKSPPPQKKTISKCLSLPPVCSLWIFQEKFRALRTDRWNPLTVCSQHK